MAIPSVGGLSGLDYDDLGNLVDYDELGNSNNLVQIDMSTHVYDYQVNSS